jgi:preprotein translocase subunit SecD
MSTITAGIKAGLIGTVALSAIMFVKDMMGVMPELNVIHMMANMVGTSVMLGWVMGRVFASQQVADIASQQQFKGVF